jgi:large subunit ribosomal protein L21
MSVKAVIKTGGKQYLVEKGQSLHVEKLADAKKAEFEALLVIDGDKIQVGTPLVKGAKVTAEVVEAVAKGDKIKILKFKAKKRQHKLTGHRQKYTEIKITGIE